MKKKTILTILLIAVLTLSACGSGSGSSASSDSASSAASALAAETQEAEKADEQEASESESVSESEAENSDQAATESLDDFAPIQGTWRFYELMYDGGNSGITRSDMDEDEIPEFSCTGTNFELKMDESTRYTGTLTKLERENYDHAYGLSFGDSRALALMNKTEATETLLIYMPTSEEEGIMLFFDK